MPELPEIELVSLAANDKLKGKTLTSYKKISAKLRQEIPNLDNVIGEILIKVVRKGKYIILEFSKHKLLIHLGMTGQFFISDTDNIEKHDHLILNFNDIIIKYNDKRRFGNIKLLNSSEVFNELNMLGLDPFSKTFNNSYLFEKTKNSKKTIKDLIIDQTVIAGIGNAYASEILFDSLFSPLKLANTLTKKDINILIISIRKILLKGIKCGGISMRDYIHFDRTKGKMQDNFLVYKKEEHNCMNCNNKIIKIKQLGRSTYYCKFCQK